MNDIVQRIHDRLNSVQRDRVAALSQLRTLQAAADSAKTTIHHLELKSLSDAARDSDPHASALHDLVELRQQRARLKQSQSDLAQLHDKLKKIEKVIDSHKFWLDYANTTDPTRQNDAKDWFKHTIEY